MADYNVFKERLRELHDLYHPEVIFATQTSGILRGGFMAKEFWRKAWPDEKQPKFLTIDVHDLMHTHSNAQLDKDSKNYKISINEFNEEVGKIDREIRGLNKDSFVYQSLMDKLKVKKDLMLQRGPREKYEPSKHPPEEDWQDYQHLVNEIQGKLNRYHIRGNVAILDECWGFGVSFGPDDEKTEEKKKHRSYDLITSPAGAHPSSTLNTAYYVVKNASQNLGNESRVLCVGLTSSDSRDTGGPWKRKEKYGIERTRGYASEGKYAKQRIEEFKKLGKEAGEELHAELQKQKSLEQRVSGVTAILGIASSLFFLNSNITGNAIADLSTKTTSFLGAGLLIVGLVAGFFWVKSRKK